MDNQSAGIKHDSDKLKWNLLPFKTLEGVIRVLMGGAKTYSPDNWKYVLPKERYFEAAIRHLTVWQSGEKIDPQYGENHLSHAICCLIFLLWHDNKEVK